MDERATDTPSRTQPNSKDFKRSCIDREVGADSKREIKRLERNCVIIWEGSYRVMDPGDRSIVTGSTNQTVSLFSRVGEPFEFLRFSE